MTNIVRSPFHWRTSSWTFGRRCISLVLACCQVLMAQGMSKPRVQRHCRTEALFVEQAFNVRALNIGHQYPAGTSREYDMAAHELGRVEKQISHADPWLSDYEARWKRIADQWERQGLIGHAGSLVQPFMAIASRTQKGLERSSTFEASAIQWRRRRDTIVAFSEFMEALTDPGHAQAAWILQPGPNEEIRYSATIVMWSSGDPVRVQVTVRLDGKAPMMFAAFYKREAGKFISLYEVQFGFDYARSDPHIDIKRLETPSSKGFKPWIRHQFVDAWYPVEGSDPHVYEACRQCLSVLLHRLNQLPHAPSETTFDLKEIPHRALPSNLNVSTLTPHELTQIRSLYDTYGRRLWEGDPLRKLYMDGGNGVTSSYITGTDGVITESGAINCNWIVLFNRATRQGAVLHVNDPGSQSFAELMLDNALRRMTDATDKADLKKNVVGLIIRARDGLHIQSQEIGDRTEMMYMTGMERLGVPHLPSIHDDRWVLEGGKLTFAVREGIILAVDHYHNAQGITQVLPLDDMVVRARGTGKIVVQPPAWARKHNAMINRDIPLIDQLTTSLAMVNSWNPIRSILVIDSHVLQNFMMTFLPFFFPDAAILTQGPVDALHLLTEQSVDMIFVSHSIGSISGIDLLPAIRRMHPDTPVVFLSGTLNRISIASDQMAALAGDIHLFFVNKPLNVADLHHLAAMTHRLECAS